MCEVESSCKEDLWLSTDEAPGHSDPSTLSQSVLDEGQCYHEILALFCSVCELKIRQLRASSGARLRIGVIRSFTFSALTRNKEVQSYSLSQGARAGRGFNELNQEVQYRQSGLGHSFDHTPCSDKSQNLGF